MKIIFSRKGIDDAYGKGSSPIMPDASLLSIPIPAKKGEHGVSYSSLYYNSVRYSTILSQLGIRVGARLCHLDPDLRYDLLPRSSAWLPCFGQHGAAASHLKNQGIASGDLFLFFGTFRETFFDHKKLSFKNDSPKRHIIFGYLKINDVLDLSNYDDRQTAMSVGYNNHPHMRNDYSKHNILYTAASAGTFKYDDSLVLSQIGSSKSNWNLPKYFSEVSISRHQNRDRYQVQKDRVILKTVSIGQDFVVSESKEVQEWALHLITSNEEMK